MAKRAVEIAWAKALKMYSETAFEDHVPEPSDVLIIGPSCMEPILIEATEWLGVTGRVFLTSRIERDCFYVFDGERIEAFDDASPREDIQGFMEAP